LQSNKRLYFICYNIHEALLNEVNLIYYYYYYYLQKLCAHGLSGGYVNWFLSCLTKRHSSVYILDSFSFHFEFFSGVPQGSVLGLLTYIYTSDLCNAIKRSKYLSFANDIFLCFKSVDDCILLETDIEHKQVWCNANFVKLNSSRTIIIAFTEKTNIRHYRDKLWDPYTSRTANIKDLGI